MANIKHASYYIPEMKAQVCASLKFVILKFLERDPKDRISVLEYQTVANLEKEKIEAHISRSSDEGVFFGSWGQEVLMEDAGQPFEKEASPEEVSAAMASKFE